MTQKRPLRATTAHQLTPSVPTRLIVLEHSRAHPSTAQPRLSAFSARETYRYSGYSAILRHGARSLIPSSCNSHAFVRSEGKVPFFSSPSSLPSFFLIQQPPFEILIKYSSIGSSYVSTQTCNENNVFSFKMYIHPSSTRPNILCFCFNFEAVEKQIFCLSPATFTPVARI